MARHRVTRIRCIALLSFAIGGSAQAACFVKADAIGANDGTNWTDAYTDLQSALRSTACSEVWAAAGSYVPGTARSDSFVVRPGSAVYGGFAGVENVREARDPAVHMTMLSGDIGTPGDISDNSYHVVRMDGTTAAGTITASTVLDGFTIRDGNASAGFPDNMGAGLYCNGNLSGRSCDPTLAHLRFVANSATYGAALALRADGFGRASPNLGDVVFSGNTATRQGGAIYVWAELNGIASPSIERATFSANKADQGGAIYNSSGSQGGTANAVIVNATFQGNDASIGTSIGNGGAIYNAGVGGTSAIALTNVTFNGNTANGANHFGGAMVNQGAGAKPTITNAIFWGNQANAMPGFYNTGGAQPTISASIVQGGCPATATCTDVQDADPLLGALADNGGFGQTMLPGTGSAAIDTGDSAACPATDQRGVPRPQGAGCDIGAVEVALPHTCHVNAAASGSNDGFSWADAYIDLQSALREASCNEVWVARGVYKPTAGTDRTISFSIRPGLKVHGGFLGTETSTAQADPGANRTVLSGDLDGNDTTDADGVTRSYSDAIGNNTYTLVRIDGTTAAGSIETDTVLDGFAISSGMGSAGIVSRTVAGALYCDGNAAGRSCSPLLSRLWLAGNQAEAGGAIFLRGENGGRSNPLLRAVTFSGNRATVTGSAIHNYGFGGEASPVLENVTFSGNLAETGTIFNQATLSGGVTRPVLRNVTFAGNQSQAAYASAIFSAAGESASAFIAIDSTIFWDTTGMPEVGFLTADGTAEIRGAVMRGGCPGGQITCQDVVSADPLLGVLQDNGGAAPTMLPGIGSSALDAGDPASCGTTPYDVDQRGVTRPQGPACDIGAVELRQMQFVVGVSGPGSVTADAVAGSAPASDGIVACDEEGEHCIAGYAIEPTAASVVLDLTPDAHAHLESILDICGPGGAAIGVLASNTYTISPLDTDCMVLASFAFDAHSVGGQVNGLAGSGLLLQLNAGETLAIASDGAFTFDTVLHHGDGYAVTIAGSPSQPTQTCAITNGSGTIDDANVTSIAVNCTTNAYTIGGTVSGLLGSGLILQLDGESLPISGDGAFVFPTAIASGNTYAVTVATPPSQPTQACSIAQGSGTVTNADITDVAVTCQAPAPHLVLTLDNDRDYLRYGRIADYVVTLRNDGDGTASNVDVSSALSPAFDRAFAQWQCFGAGSGASCTATGTGTLIDTVTLPPDRSVSWLVRAPVLGDTPEPDASFTVTVAGATPESVTDTDILVILRDGFDVPYSDGTHVDEPESVAILEGDASYAFAMTPPGHQRIDDVLHMHAQETDVRVQRTVLDADV